MPKKKGKRKNRRRIRRYSSLRLKAVVGLLTLASLAAFALAAALIYHYYRFSRLIEARLHSEGPARSAWVYSRPFELRSGQRLSASELLDVLNALQYRRMSSRPTEPGTFHAQGSEVLLRLRQEDRTVRVQFERLWISELEDRDTGSRLARVELEPVPVTTLFGEDRAKRQWVPLTALPDHLVQAVVATEDRRFFRHTGLDPMGIARAAYEDIRAGEIRQGGSTLTQQLVKNYFLTSERSLRRKLLEALLALILENRMSKEEILELYLNDVYLGQRGSFGIHGVGQAARSFFGKDARNLTLEESALLAALIRAPNTASPYRDPGVAKNRRDIVLQQMARAGFVVPERAELAIRRPVEVRHAIVDVSEAPYFIDVLREQLLDRHGPGILDRGDLSVYATLDRYLQSAAQRAVREGLQEIESKLPRREGGRSIQTALVSLDPANGDVLALVGGRSYGESQYNRAVSARRQPGSAFKPFVYLAAFEHAYRQSVDRGRPATPLFAPASFVMDEPTTFRYGNRRWTPQNYDRRFRGRVSFREALAFSLNVATARVGQEVGFERVAELWSRMGMSSGIEPYPSVVLGAFETSPLELATAYTVIANGGSKVEPRFFHGLREGSATVESGRAQRQRLMPSSPAYLVTDMMRSVIDEGTGREIRARGFNVDAAGKTGTTNDTRDAWFVGFTPDVLAAVWVGYDDNARLGLAGSQAALPIWTRFMKAAVSGRESSRFELPAGVVTLRIDPDSGGVARPSCPRSRQEVFLEGAQPVESCPLH